MGGGAGGDAQPRFRLEHGSRVDQVAFLPDGATLASISRPANLSDPDGDAKLADVASGKVLETGRIPAYCMAFFPKSDRLALGRLDGTLVLTNQKKLTTWKSIPVGSSVAYPVAVWDIPSRRAFQMLPANEGLPRQSRCLAFSPDGRPRGHEQLPGRRGGVGD